jgi:hypothetical protein
MEPVIVGLDAPLEVANWRALVSWLLVIPQLFVAYALRAAARALVVISFFTILFTRRVPDGIVAFQAMSLRYQWRVQTYLFFMREPYPPFSFDTVLEDPGDDPAVFSLAAPGELNRWLPLVKWLLLVPHYLALIVLGIGVLFVWIGAFFAVLFTGRWPEGMRRYVIGVARWSLRVETYLDFLHDEYPPFRLE